MKTSATVLVLLALLAFIPCAQSTAQTLPAPAPCRGLRDHGGARPRGDRGLPGDPVGRSEQRRERSGARPLVHDRLHQQRPVPGRQALLLPLRHRRLHQHVHHADQGPLPALPLIARISPAPPLDGGAGLLNATFASAGASFAARDAALASPAAPFASSARACLPSGEHFALPGESFASSARAPNPVEETAPPCTRSLPPPAANARAPRMKGAPEKANGAIRGRAPPFASHLCTNAFRPPRQSAA